MTADYLYSCSHENVNRMHEEEQHVIQFIKLVIHTSASKRLSCTALDLERTKHQPGPRPGPALICDTWWKRQRLK